MLEKVNLKIEMLFRSFSESQMMFLNNIDS